MKAKVIILVAGLSGLAGCFFEETKTVEYYQVHESEREAQIAQCVDNPGEDRFRPNCINAEMATHRDILRGTGQPLPAFGPD